MGTDLSKIKKSCKAFFDIGCREPNKEFGSIMSHTYSNSIFAYSNTENRILDLTKDEDFKIFRFETFKHINKCDSVIGLYLMVNEPYRLLWLREFQDILGEKDYSELLGYTWTTSENPNQDTNVSLESATEMFKSAIPQHMMDEEDYEKFISIPETITLYRGVMDGHNPDGLSYTADKEKALWFANRWNKSGELLTLTVNKSDILAYFNTRNEDEYVVDVPGLKKKKKFKPKRESC